MLEADGAPKVDDLAKLENQVGVSSGGVLEKDPAPHLTARQEQIVKLLESHKAPFRRYPKCFLCLMGLSPYYHFDDNSYPAFERPNGTDMGLLDFIKTADPRKVRAVEVQKGDDQVTLLESTQNCFMPLVIPAAGGSSSVAATKIPALTEKGQEGVAEGNAYLELADPDEGTAMVRPSDEEVVTEKPKKIKKKRLIKQSNVLPAKKLRMDHPSLASGTRSSSILCAPVDTAAATTTSTKAKLAADVNPDLADCWRRRSEILRLKSQLAEKEAESAEVVRFRDQVSSLSGEKSALTAEVSALTVTTRMPSGLYRGRGLSLSSLAFLERDRLSSEVSSLRAGFKDFKEKMEIQQEEQAQELYIRVAELEAHVMDVSGHLEGEFYPTYLTLLAGRRWLLTHGIQLALLKCLKSSEYQGILGHALGRAVDFGMQEGLEAGQDQGVAGRSLSVVDAYNPEAASADYVNAVKALKDAHFPLGRSVEIQKGYREE
ncbi:hypothetical protein Tco_1346555 [Tanacetum coccineum]